jgi:tRNA (guanine37-N1)-methyltransferase
MLHQLRDYATDKHHTVDDKPYGGGPGMLLKCEPIFRRGGGCAKKAATPGRVDSCSARPARSSTRPRRASWPGWSASFFSAAITRAIDERVREHLVDEELCIGDFILTNGALAALVVIDAVVRLLPDVVGNEASTQSESFSAERPWLEGPQYTRPEEFRGWRVPEILLSGHHGRSRNGAANRAGSRTEARVRPGSCGRWRMTRSRQRKA